MGYDISDSDIGYDISDSGMGYDISDSDIGYDISGSDIGYDISDSDMGRDAWGPAAETTQLGYMDSDVWTRVYGLGYMDTCATSSVVLSLSISCLSLSMDSFSRSTASLPRSTASLSFSIACLSFSSDCFSFSRACISRSIPDFSSSASITATSRFACEEEVVGMEGAERGGVSARARMGESECEDGWE